MRDAALEEAARQVDSMPMLHTPRERTSIRTGGAPLDFYAGRNGRLYANGEEFHFKGINWCASRLCPDAACPCDVSAMRPRT